MRRGYSPVEMATAAGITAATAFFTAATTWRGQWSVASASMASLLWASIAALAVLAVVARRPAHRPTTAVDTCVGQEFPEFPTRRYLRAVEEAKQLVRIQDACIGFLLEPELRERAVVAFRRLLQDAGGRVEIVLMEPQAIEVGLRAEALTAAFENPQDYVERVKANLCHLYQFRKTLTESARSRFEVTLVSWLPGVTCYQADDVLLTAVFPLYRRSDDAPQICVAEDSPPGHVVSEAFRFLRDQVGHGFEERMLLAVASGDVDLDADAAAGNGCRMRYVGPDSDDCVYVLAGDCAIADGERVVADLPDDDGDSVRRRYEARVFERSEPRFTRVADELVSKYGDEIAEERVLALLPA
ncbi:hypothetical protein KGQ19_29680 [Catenulispora sp. NL8]|uniref:Uncharacterized protein n=1 Tax=Catenulispora pinistramenti TaxID=2705254 RepID=A0ABS5KYA9_9ACTN|nr:hypothetical protein [Catenulispora pinistramenti]MBS2551048.1 hypothetical protein [Catenulispora pinistramenti]